MVSRVVISLNALTVLPHRKIVEALSEHFAHDWKTAGRASPQDPDFSMKGDKQSSFHRFSASDFYVLSVRRSLTPTILLAYEVSDGTIAGLV